MKLIEELNPHQFAEYLKNNYSHFSVYKDNKYLGTAKYIFGVYAYVEELDQKYKIIDIADTTNNGAILYVE